MEKLSGGEKEIWWRTEGDKVWSLLLAHFQPFFQLLARILTVFDKKYLILMCGEKRESYLIVFQ